MTTSPPKLPRIVGELRNWQLLSRPVGPRSIRLGHVVVGDVYNDITGRKPDGTRITIRDVSVSDHRGKFLFGDGHGTSRIYYVAYKITRKDE